MITLGEFDPILPMLAVPDYGNIVVAGSYKGDYADHLSGMFPTARIHGYEPQKEMFNESVARHAGNGRIEYRNAGLGTSRRLVSMAKAGTVGATMVGGNGCYLAKLLDAVEELATIGAVDLFVVNMEGYEWVLLPHLFNELMHRRINSMAIQFHGGFTTPIESAVLLDRLNNHYDCLHWNYPTWTYWKRKL